MPSPQESSGRLGETMSRLRHHRVLCCTEYERLRKFANLFLQVPFYRASSISRTGCQLLLCMTSISPINGKQNPSPNLTFSRLPMKASIFILALTGWEVGSLRGAKPR